ncbi:hypothetical protein U9M48_024781 [Paspalum notatum var. saurae]|uniref:Uncharacterized protein n=1 Tax=Paspalum notatum var. saurae TaxID=547442 RepID=A0AAQ3WWX9_PASNO
MAIEISSYEKLLTGLPSSLLYYYRFHIKYTGVPCAPFLQSMPAMSLKQANAFLISSDDSGGVHAKPAFVLLSNFTRATGFLHRLPSPRLLRRGSSSSSSRLLRRGSSSSSPRLLRRGSSSSSQLGRCLEGKQRGGGGEQHKPRRVTGDEGVLLVLPSSTPPREVAGAPQERPPPEVTAGGTEEGVGGGNARPRWRTVRSAIHEIRRRGAPRCRRRRPNAEDSEIQRRGAPRRQRRRRGSGNGPAGAHAGLGEAGPPEEHRIRDLWERPGRASRLAGSPKHGHGPCVAGLQLERSCQTPP